MDDIDDIKQAPDVDRARISVMTRQYSGEWEFDAFVCFAGDDTRHLFTSHLAGNLWDRKVKAFTDEIFGRTINIDEILPLIGRTPVSVVLFSKNFAKSMFCLDEVVRISQHMERCGHRVLPVFYRVDPKDVSDDEDLPTASSQEEKERWLKALKYVAKHAGHTTIEIKDDYQLCMKIVNDVLKALIDVSSSGKLKYLVGMEARVLKVEQFLAMQGNNSNATRVIGLWGMGGLGKTTLADAWYHKLTSPTNLVKHHFVSDINGKCKERHRVEELVLELYSTLLSENNLSLKDLDVVFRRERLSRSKVVVVLDNVETRQQLDHLLLGEILDLNKLFGSGSIIIITSRDRGVLNHATEEVFNVEGLSSPESLQLFMLHAFRRPICATDDFMNLPRRIVSYCKGNPLALRVLGAALHDKDETYWNSFFSRLKNMSNPDIHDVLSTSYYFLEGELQRLFMDVASFLFNTRRTRLMKYLATSYKSAYSLVLDLIDKSLLSVHSNSDPDELIVVHDLLKEMAWKIVKSEGNPSRLRNPNDLCELFEVEEAEQYCGKCSEGKPEYVHNKDAFDGGKGIESLVLDLSKAKKIDLGAKAFDGMNSLRFIGFHNQGVVPGEPKIRLLNGRLDILPKELRWLEWFGFPSEYLPEKFLPQKLVALILRHSRIQRCWEGKQQPNLVHLVTLDLSYSIDLKALPDLSQCKKLEVLRLKGCKSLIELPSHVENLEALVEVDVSECQNLMYLPARLISKCLKYVRLAKCPKLTCCPEIVSSEEGDVLEVLDLEGTPVMELPSAIYNVKRGGILRLCGKHITTFPRVSNCLQLFRLCHTAMKQMDVSSSTTSLDDSLPLLRFDKLELVGNSQLVSLSSSIWDMVKYELYVVDSPLLESLPDIENSINDLTGVFIESCVNLKSFPSGIENLIKSVQTIHWLGTAIQSIPSSIYLLDKLSVLNLSFSHSLEEIPDGLNRLPKLYMLALRGCANLKSLPRLLPPMLQVLTISGCKSLQALPSNICELKLSFLRFENCLELEKELGDQIVAGFHSCAKMSQKPKGSVLYSGSSLPAWCSNDFLNHKMELPTKQQQQLNPVNRIVFAVIFSSDATVVELSMECSIVTGNKTTVATFSSPVIRICGGSVDSPSDYVFLWFDNKLSGEPKEAMEDDEEEDEEAPAWYMKYAGKSVSLCVRAVPEEEDVHKVNSIEFKRLSILLM